MNEQAWANAVVNQCVASGIDHFFLAPGSRCTPLTLAIARNEKSCVTQHFDERGLAFAVLGFGRASGRPGVFVCTSGTAVANAFPAVVEASAECVPMLLFTADRPDELRGTGANQTIDQREIFGSYPRMFSQMPVPEDLRSDAAGQGFLQGSLHSCIRESRSGPVHVNFMFREPFSIEEVDEPDKKSKTDGNGSVEKMPDEISVKVKGDAVIVLGSCNPEEAHEALQLADKLKCPMLSDITSGLRTGSLELPAEFSLPKPDTVLHLGGRVVSKSWLAWCSSIQDTATDFIHLTPTGRTFNPNRLTQQKIRMPLKDLVSNVDGPCTSQTFRDQWNLAAIRRNEIINSQLADTKTMSEAAIAFHLFEICPAAQGLFVGNSMPIRDLDWFGVDNTVDVRLIEANRGASGIDGLIATAAGYALGLQRPTTVVLGDLSALHDLNSLALVATSATPMVVVIINNKGGHIFDQLPIRQSPHFEQYFATPHGYGFEYAARMFDIPYLGISDMEHFKASYQEAVSDGKSIVLELFTDRLSNIETRQILQKEIRRCSKS